VNTTNQLDERANLYAEEVARGLDKANNHAIKEAYREGYRAAIADIKAQRRKLDELHKRLKGTKSPNDFADTFWKYLREL
jgi:hypothetical protein